MESTNRARQSPPDLSISGPGSAQGPDVADAAQLDAGSNNATSQRVPKKRTKTGCLTCRKRRIKCGEEKPTCNNCVKSKRECKGYGPRLIFKNPLGISGPGFGQQPAFSVQTQSTPVPSEHSVSQQRKDRPDQPALAPKLPLPSDAETRNPTAPSSLNEGPGISRSPPQPVVSGQVHLPSSSENSSESYTPPDTLAFLDHHRRQLSTDLGAGYSWSDAVSYPQGGPWLPNTAPSGVNLLQDQVRTASSAQVPLSQSSTSPYGDYMEDDGEDDYYSGESEEEREDQISVQNYNQLSLIMASANRDERQLRSFTTYLNEPNVLGSYIPTYGSSPLNNPKTARIFLHFIHSTGPSLSVFERHPIDPSTMLGAPVPTAQQGLWTYTLPLKALESQVLLQAILALSSLHISFLQQAPPTVSLKHYHYALRRVGVAVGLPTRRKQITTLAATLLLGYYEVMGADHSKWNSHVAGSAQLVREIDFAGMTRGLRAQRRRVWAQRQQMQPPVMALTDSYLFGDPTSDDDPFAEKESSINDQLIGTLLGRAVNYDEFGQINDDSGNPRQYKHFTRKDIENYRIQCDLYWWYCKQDVMQSIISGCPLFMPYSQWGQCPPRAGMGRMDAIYGSADHLWLLLGRLAEFGYRDRKRKLRTAKTTGMEWRPDANLGKFMARFARGPPGAPRGGGPPPPGGPPGGPPPRQSPPGAPDMRRGGPPPTGPGPNAPPMYGMAPSSGPRRAPAVFLNTRETHYHYPPEEEEEDTSYHDAEKEWESMVAAFDAFLPALGPYFMPLPADSVPPISTPFGPALQYRTHTIATIWCFYYTGRILLHRLHPCMPPAMMVAAGVAAATTAEYAQIIGRIAAGVYYPQSFHLEAGSLSPTLGSCLIEITVPLFFAGVQYTDPAQREWLVTELLDLNRLSGWRTSDAIARGCENAWVVAAAQGRGPPYTRRDRTLNQPASMWTPPPEAEEDSNGGGSGPYTSSERRFITVSKRPNANWAMGILSLEDDILNLDINDRT
ncbi:hypothetical protein BO86DRAFT_72304 [Aspergillus japonicus CBS 114.51]|uniref:Zn(2)-C6 fungal-type domain-containing protein n=1 Tax=Aspergillus japonicus CBS 114.51 TaxID=1448312 RepID=A0A8T8X3F0_ASPJA|nr:hypothetical protein BO86DRAFT_72304 [Aspergillus japonicus CBS 114.51]RAH82606.1 hypothetical protein BO86DRAFT_72304 [Aspergillus japonicus CBS 114.51]